MLLWICSYCTTAHSSYLLNFFFCFGWFVHQRIVLLIRDTLYTNNVVISAHFFLFVSCFQRDKNNISWNKRLCRFLQSKWMHSTNWCVLFLYIMFCLVSCWILRRLSLLQCNLHTQIVSFESSFFHWKELCTLMLQYDLFFYVTFYFSPSEWERERLINFKMTHENMIIFQRSCTFAQTYRHTHTHAI